MGYEQVLARLGLGGLSGPDVFAAQIFLLAFTLVLFIGAIALCILAFRAVGAARRLREDVDTQFRAVQDLAVEVRHLTAQVEKAVTRRTSVPETPSRSARVGAAATTPEAEVEVSTDERNARSRNQERDEAAAQTTADDAERDRGSSQMLDAAKRAATEPAAILRSIMRRKK
ncbi:MAG: hypothetical protein ACE5FO_04690 [Parvularculaceae bacterium]